MKPTEQITTKLRSLELFLSAHPENEPDSEMADRLSDVIEIQQAISQMQPEDNNG